MKNIKKRALLISPYLDIQGGGERHILSILEIFDKNGFACDIRWHDQGIIKECEKNLDISFANARVVSNPLPSQEYDYCFYVTDGSYFFSRAQRKYVFFMYPKRELLPLGLINRLKTNGWQFFTNGEFTREKIATMLEKKITVVHPFIDDISSANIKKQHLILSVGRFFPHLHSKKQEILINTFNQLQKTYEKFKNYRLILAGALKNAKQDQEYFDHLQRLKGDNKAIEFRTNIGRNELVEFYRKAEIYWHAAGYGLDENKHPEGVEHLGISPLEAMAAGAVTFCHNSGGPKRYIKSGENGFLYGDIHDLVEKTAHLDGEKQSEIAKKGHSYVKENFSKEVFEKKVIEYFEL